VAVAEKPIAKKPAEVAEPRHGTSATTMVLSLAALGVVFGDIGTSPIYTLPVCFQFSGAAPTVENVLGICSLIVWTLVLVVCVKYISFIMRVDHQGEGGILALLALAVPRKARGPIGAGVLTTFVIVGAAMLFGDGMITPAISVISAVEGLSVVTRDAQPFIVPLSVVILLALFAVQARGTEAVGRLFGPAMLLWFVAIGAAGAIAIFSQPAILQAFDPRHAAMFVSHHGIGGFLVLGGLVLAITGVEALYADLSHFGRKPIAMAWYAVVFPALVLCYLGQGARVMAAPAVLNKAFFALSPGWTLLPMIAIATAATIIASQALISGAFTLVEQAIALGLWPRTEVRHTSSALRGQVYVPAVNATLAIGCIGLVFAFGSSARLAAAYGLAVACTMLATSLAYYAVLRNVRGWSRARAAALVGWFVLIDAAFVLACLPKIQSGGWFPLAVATCIAVVVSTWLEGRRCMSKALFDQQMPVAEVARMLQHKVAPETPTMVLLTPDPAGVPFFAHHGWVRDRAREERVVLLHLAPAKRPYISDEERVTVERYSPAFTGVTIRFGYMELPRLESIVRGCGKVGVLLEREDTSFFYADPKVERALDDPFPAWRRHLFEALRRMQRPLPDDLGIPAERRIELGVSIAI
jgi:KUP system potassium uptake protein